MNAADVISQLKSLIDNSQSFIEADPDEMDLPDSIEESIWKADIEALNIAIEAVNHYTAYKEPLVFQDPYGTERPHCPVCEEKWALYPTQKFCCQCGQKVKP